MDYQFTNRRMLSTKISYCTKRQLVNFFHKYSKIGIFDDVTIT